MNCSVPQNSVVQGMVSRVFVYVKIWTALRDNLLRVTAVRPFCGGTREVGYKGLDGS